MKREFYTYVSSRAGSPSAKAHQGFRTRSKQNLPVLVFGKNVIMDWHKRDRYGSIIGKVLAPACDRSVCADVQS